MKPSSAKAKGRRLQQEVRDLFLENAPSLEPDDIRSTSMGAAGEDILFSPAARKLYPFSVECKNVEKLNVWEAIKQAKEHNPKYTPLVAFTKNGEDIYVAIPIKKFLEILASGNSVFSCSPTGTSD